MLQSLSDRHQEQGKSDPETSIVDDSTKLREASKANERSQLARDDEQLDSSSEQQDDCSNRPKRNPYCSRCRNHGKSAQVKGHKRHCEYRDCQCEGCKLVECRQIVSAAQIKRRRYQKQDEECGRRIEISPPVLTREPSNDPASLIAKTLINSANTKHLQQQAAAQKQLAAMAAHSQHQNGPASHLAGMHPAAANLAAAALAAAANNSQSSSANSLHHHNQQQPHNQPPNHLHQLGAPLMASPPASQPTNPSAARNNLQGAHHLNQLTNQLALGQHNSQQSSSSSAALGNAFHLFSFPNSVLSAMRDSHGALQSAPQTTLASDSTNQATPTLAGTLSFRDQISLVEEIYHTFGPLAIYAWLRSEQFDLQKVRDSIEIAHGSYNNLMDLKSKFRLSASGHHNSIQPNSNQQHQSGPNHSSSVDHRMLAGCIHDQNLKTNHTLQTTSGSDSKTTTNTTATIINNNNNNNNSNQCLSSIVSSSANLTATLHSSPNYTFGSAFTGHNSNGGLINCSSGGGGCIGMVPNSVNHHCGMSLANTFTSLPMTTAQSLLWPEFKLTTSGAPSTVLQSAQHLLPHFMHHHPFMAQHHQLNHKQINDQQHHQQNQQASPTGSSLTTSSCSETSTSTNAS